MVTAQAGTTIVMKDTITAAAISSLFRLCPKTRQTMPSLLFYSASAKQCQVYCFTVHPPNNAKFTVLQLHPPNNAKLTVLHRIRQTMPTLLFYTAPPKQYQVYCFTLHPPNNAKFTALQLHPPNNAKFTVLQCTHRH